MFILARIKIPAEIAGWILVVGAPFVMLGLVYTVGEPVANFFTRNLDEKQADKHIATRIVNWIAIIAAIVALLLVSLPAFGITPLGDPFNFA